MPAHFHCPEEMDKLFDLSADIAGREETANSDKPFSFIRTALDLSFGQTQRTI
jgi:hypothetical protein